MFLVYYPYMADKKQNEHYVNNKEFTTAVAEHNEAVKLAESKGETPPRMSDYIGECIYKIATRLSTRPNFINYTYRDEMICDAIENCIQYIGNFNREKSNNAFAYITQICYYAFLRRIQKEKKHLYVKYKAMENEVIVSLIENNGEDVVVNQLSGVLHDSYSQDFINDFINTFEKSKRKKTKKKENVQ